MRELKMADVRREEGKNGLTVASLFAGAGGSSLGYRLAGFRVPFACEWDTYAAATNALNGPEFPIDDERAYEVAMTSIVRDVRELTAADIGEVDVLDGSPRRAKASRPAGKATPKQEVESFAGSSSGSSMKCDRGPSWRRTSRASPMNRCRALLPARSSRRRGLGYRAEARVLDASWLGAPQARERVVIVGVREDLGADPPFPRT